MEDSKFDAVIFGTGLVESIVAAALSKWGFKVVHIDQNPYYGGDEASLTLDKFAKWIDAHSGPSSRYSNAIRSSEVPPFARQYSICLCPTINPSLGPFIDALIQSGVSKYSGFRLLERVVVYDGVSAFRSVPGSKEDVFRNRDISLVQKRRLMRFLTFAAGDFEQSSELEGRHTLPFISFLGSVFSLNQELIAVIAYALAYSSTATDPTISVLRRIRRYLRSVGRYGPSPFLVGHYGGVGEISQGFCRTAAVNGAVYILGRQILSISNNPIAEETDSAAAQTNVSQRSPRYSVTLQDVPEPLTTRVVLGSAFYAPEQLRSLTRRIPQLPAHGAIYETKSICRCVAIIEHPVELHAFSDSTSEKEGDDKEDSDGEISESQQDTPKAEATANTSLDTAVLVFPPQSLDGGSHESSAIVLMTGEGALSSPKGKFILYISLPVSNGIQVDPSQVLHPYLDAILKLGREEPQKPLFTAFYTEHLEGTDSFEADGSLTNNGAAWIVPPALPLCPLGDVADVAAENAELIFREILLELDNNESRYHKDDAVNGGIWPRTAFAEDESDE